MEKRLKVGNHGYTASQKDIIMAASATQAIAEVLDWTVTVPVRLEKNERRKAIQEVEL